MNVIQFIVLIFLPAHHTMCFHVKRLQPFSGNNAWPAKPRCTLKDTHPTEL